MVYASGMLHSLPVRFARFLPCRLTDIQLYSARNDAISRIVKECQSRGGNAVIALRFDAGDMGGFAQVCAYGTACIVEKIDEQLPEYPQLLRQPVMQ